jgi:hypothetical protein
VHCMRWAARLGSTPRPGLEGMPSGGYRLIGVNGTDLTVGPGDHFSVCWSGNLGGHIEIADTTLDPSVEPDRR